MKFLSKTKFLTHSCNFSSGRFKLLIRYWIWRIFWDHIIFRVNGEGGDQSSVTEYKERTIEDWLPMRRIIRVLQSCSGGIRDQANFITTPPKSFYPPLPCSVIINCPVLNLWWTDTHVKLAVRFILNLKNPKRNSGFNYSLLNTG